MTRKTFEAHKHCGGRMSRSIGEGSGMCTKCGKRVTGDATERKRIKRSRRDLPPTENSE